MTIDLYGIKNCDTMKKAMRWLDDNKVAYVMHDYKKTGAPAGLLKQAIAMHGWENVINRKGTSWRALPEAVKHGMSAAGALDAVRDNPSLIRRPMLVRDGVIHLGFDPVHYAALFEAE